MTEVSERLAMLDAKVKPIFPAASDELAGLPEAYDQRLWISSMDDSANPRDALRNLAPRYGPTMVWRNCGPLLRLKADSAGGFDADPAVLRADHRTLNIGRVMSPTLALIVQREAEIDTFKPVPFYTVTLELPGFTVSGERMADKAAAEQLKTTCQGAAVTVKKVERKEKSEKAPALYDLTMLQERCQPAAGIYRPANPRLPPKSVRKEALHLSPNRQPLSDERYG